MNDDFDFTKSQLNLIERVGSIFVEACPGAGKTQTIAERFAVRPNAHPRKGVALLSFTNAAADEARLRCSGDPSLLTAPNFVGTIDKFLNRFIVSPFATSRDGVRTHFVDTWSQLPNVTVRLTGRQGVFLLDWFDFHSDDTATLHGRTAPYIARKKIEALSSTQRIEFEAEATRIRKTLINRGYYSAEASRQVADSILADSSDRSKLTALIGSRFSEVIVDEVQDCSGSDFNVLQLFKEAGVMIVLVGDPDQAIYDFRQLQSSSPVPALSTLAPTGDRLDGNFRSTPAICAIAGSLRVSTSSVDIARGPNRNSETPIYIFGYSDIKSIAPCIELLRTSEGYRLDQTVILSHNWNTARSVAGGSKPELNSDSKLVRIASAIRCLHDETNTRLRQSALHDLANTLHESSNKELRKLALMDFLEKIGLSERQFLTSVLRVATSTAFDKNPSTFKNSLMQALSSNSFDWVGSLTIPRGDKWPAMPNWGKKTSIQYGTIHSYKGLQQQFVTMVIPEDHESRTRDQSGVLLWHEDRDGEPRRVLYVGATRAQKLLMLAVHESHLDKVLSRLTRDTVPFRYIRLLENRIEDAY
ncbi:UvrD-helicase domain-containing protein [Rhodococcus sp. 14-2483-1-2]|uniref:UvrD-helicase domain-containing protein n=1 Tax=Rhodococcus sp. 14-2483-1-2 TaxID=2023147 RepID=UPI001482A18E|nr:UvrD-helicase domain-containing protein [Rhodococcus sp. 14-2483-1-2]